MQTPLHDACWNGNIPIVFCLVKFGASPNLTNVDKDTPLNYACFRNEPEIAACLIAYGGDTSIANNTSNTPMQYARQHGFHLKLQQTLKNRGASFFNF